MLPSRAVDVTWTACAAAEKCPSHEKLSCQSCFYPILLASRNILTLYLQPLCFCWHGAVMVLPQNTGAMMRIFHTSAEDGLTFFLDML